MVPPSTLPAETTARGFAVTVNVAGVLVTVFAGPVTVTVYWSPLSGVRTGAVIYFQFRAPVMGEPFLLHW